MELKPRYPFISLGWLLVLIVPFMELKHGWGADPLGGSTRLNRTFYGIETARAHDLLAIRLVLIVPFMELKPFEACFFIRRAWVLIVPFMELKLQFVSIARAIFLS